MQITYDPAKREWTLLERGLDFARSAEVFAGQHYSAEDLRQDYPESRWITIGLLDKRMVLVVWTPRNHDERRIISMRKANEREQEKYRFYFE